MPPFEELLYDGTDTIDPRKDPRVVNGWDIEELVAGDAPVNWKKKKESELPQNPTWTQGSSSACVAFSKARQISVRVKNLTGLWIDYSPASIYQLRSNRPKGGMNIADANSIVDKRGVALEAYMRSFGLNEAGINATLRSPVAELSSKVMAEAVAKYFYCPINMEKIAQTIEAGKAVSLLIFATENEYARETPVVNANITYETAPIRHEVLAEDYLLNSSGKKVLFIQDSAHFGGISKRYFTEEFLTKRVIIADAIEMFNLVASVPTPNARPVYLGTIVSLQKCLKWEGVFPQSVAVVESFGPTTQKAVRDFQSKYGLPLVNAITSDVRAKLFSLYPMPEAAGPVETNDVPKIPYRGI